jgi:hypothetical protein
MRATGISSQEGLSPNFFSKITFKHFKIIYTERPRGFRSESILK